MKRPGDLAMTAMTAMTATTAMTALALSAVMTPGAAPAATPGTTPATNSSGQWPTFRGDAQLTGVAHGDLAAAPALLWSFEAAAGIESTAAVQHGLVYFGSLDGTLYCLALEDGALRWKYGAGAAIKSSPSVFDGTVYFGDDNGLFHAVDASSGKGRWTFATEAAIISSANKAAGNVIFGSNDNNLYAVSTATGKLAWKVATGSYVYSTPALVQGKGEPALVSTGCDGYLRIVRARDGAELRKFSLGAYVGASPVLKDGRAYVGTFENQVLGLDLGAGKILWTYEHPERKFPYYSSAAIGEGLVVIGGRDRMVHALRAADGKEAWNYAAGAKVDASPVIVGDRVIAATTGGDILVLGLREGDLRWRYETGSSIVASPGVADGRLLIGTSGGRMLAFGGR